MLRRKEFNPSMVSLLHIPTGIVASCGMETAQHRNKRQALSLLKSRIWASEHLGGELPLLASYVLPQDVQYPEDLQQFQRLIKSPR